MIKQIIFILLVVFVILARNQQLKNTKHLLGHNLSMKPDESCLPNTDLGGQKKEEILANQARKNLSKLIIWQQSWKRIRSIKKRQKNEKKLKQNFDIGENIIIEFQLLFIEYQYHEVFQNQYQLNKETMSNLQVFISKDKFTKISSVQQVSYFQVIIIHPKSIQPLILFY